MPRDGGIVFLPLIGQPHIGEPIPSCMLHPAKDAALRPGPNASGPQLPNSSGSGFAIAPLPSLRAMDSRTEMRLRGMFATKNTNSKTGGLPHADTATSGAAFARCAPSALSRVFIARQVYIFHSRHGTLPFVVCQEGRVVEYTRRGNCPERNSRIVDECLSSSNASVLTHDLDAGPLLRNLVERL